MKPKLKIGILKETKTPPDRRTAIAPKQGIDLINKFPNIELFIQSSDIRAYSDGEYTALGLNVVDDVSHCDILIGVKEVHIPELIANKTYLYFSHTAKEQEYNRSLLQEMLKKNIRMLDYEYFTDDKGVRLVAFGRWAGLVGAYNGLIAYGKRTGTFDLKRAIKCHDTNEMFAELKKVKLPPIKIVITGGGRVAHGAMETLAPLNITEVSPKDFLTKEYDEPVFAQLNPDSYVKEKTGQHSICTISLKTPKCMNLHLNPLQKLQICILHVIFGMKNHLIS
jgi:saccharopine dehydrogenase (NAD+, L-lysine-forming)